MKQTKASGKRGVSGAGAGERLRDRVLAAELAGVDRNPGGT